MFGKDKPVTNRSVRWSVTRGKVMGAAILAVLGVAFWQFLGPKIGLKNEVEPESTAIVSIDPKWFKIEASKGKFSYSVKTKQFLNFEGGIVEDIPIIGGLTAKGMNKFSRALYHEDSTLSGWAGMGMQVPLPPKNKLKVRIDREKNIVSIDLGLPYASKENIVWPMAKVGGYRVHNVGTGIGNKVFAPFSDNQINLQPGFAKAADQVLNKAKSPMVYPKLIRAAKERFYQRLFVEFIQPIVNAVDPQGWKFVINWKKEDGGILQQLGV